MKYLVVCDFHGKTLEKLDDVVEGEKPDALIIPGPDFDTIESLNSYLELRKRFLDEGKEVFEVPGNHEKIHYHDRKHVNGSDWEPFGCYAEVLKIKSPKELHDDLMADRDAKEYVRKLLKEPKPFTIVIPSEDVPNKSLNDSDRKSIDFGQIEVIEHRKKFFLDTEKFGEEYQTVLLHGSYYCKKILDRSLEYYGKGPQISYLHMHGRIANGDDIHENFRLMSEQGDKIMIRGHNHDSCFLGYDNATGNIFKPIDSNGLVNPKGIPQNCRYNLEKDIHILNPGAFFYGRFAMIYTRLKDFDKPCVVYHEL